MKIFKYAIPSPDHGYAFAHQIPWGAKFLKAEVQGDTAQMWFMVDPNNAPETRHFMTFGTGHEFNPDQKDYLTTFQAPPYVWHLFEYKMAQTEQQA